MKSLLSSLILVVALFIPHYLQAREINGVYSATIAKTGGRGGLVARLSGAKQKVRLFLYEYCQGEKLTKEPDSDKEWRDFQRQLEEIKMKILYPRGATTRQHRGVFFRLKNGKEWLSLGATDKVKLYVDNEPFFGS